MANAERLLEVKDLKTYFDSDAGPIRAVDGVSFHIDRGETLAVVGESGSGKSVTSLSVMRLIPRLPGASPAGKSSSRAGPAAEIERAMRRIRGNDIAMIFQEPMTSLNPVFTIGDQITETVMLHQSKSRPQAMRTAIEMLELVGIPEPARRAKSFPHQMSGGMRQRVMIAMALSCNPKLLIADEPTTALDVTIQAQILDLMRKLQRNQHGMLFITHDLGVVAEMADRVVVMYAGRAVEEADVDAIFADPKMPYTIGLMDSVPRVDKGRWTRSGCGPFPATCRTRCLPPGCAFNARCRHVIERCRVDAPALEDTGSGHMSAAGAGMSSRRSWRRDAVTPKPPLKNSRPQSWSRSRTCRSISRSRAACSPAWSATSRRSHDISFDVNEGEVVGLVGESGSGKTTAGRAILRLIEPTGGQILFEVRTSPRRRRPSSGSSARTCRSFSRTRTPRSIRG